VALVGNGSFVEMSVNAKLYAAEDVMSMASACAASECFESKNIVSTNEGPLVSSVGAAQWAVTKKGAKNLVCIGLNIPSVGQYSCGWTEKYMQSKGLKASSILMDPGSADVNAAVLPDGRFGRGYGAGQSAGRPCRRLSEGGAEQNLRDQFI